MSVTIKFYNETEESVEIYEDVIRLVIDEAVNQENLVGQYNCSFIFVDNAKIKTMNSQYRGKDYATDVLTFNDGSQTLGGGISLGDVFISLDKMIEQAYEYGHGEVREMAFLAVHGFLHLLGYDHQDEAGEKEMFGKQEAILDAKDIRR